MKRVLKADLELCNKATPGPFIRRMNMIKVLRVDVNWLETGTFENPKGVIYDGLTVHYFNRGMEGRVTLDIPENVAMNLTLNDIRERVVLKLRGVL